MLFRTVPRWQGGRPVTLPGLLLIGALVAVLALAPAQASRATGPIDLDGTGRITDRVNALAGRQAEVDRALSRLEEQQGLRLFVAYVRNFSGQEPGAWARETAARNGLGERDLLLAIAIEDRGYALAAAPGSGLSGVPARQVGESAIAPALARGDWAGAAIGAADGYAAVLAGDPAPSEAAAEDPEASRDDDVTSWSVLLVLLAAAGVLAFFLFRRGSPPGTGNHVPQ